MNNKSLDIKVDVLNLQNVKKAFTVANNAIYFNDRSDYLFTLYEVCKLLAPGLEENIGTKYIENK